MVEERSVCWWWWSWDEVAESESESEDGGESGGGRVLLEVILGLIDEQGFAMEIWCDYRFIGTLARFLTDLASRHIVPQRTKTHKKNQRSPTLLVLF